MRPAGVIRTPLLDHRLDDRGDGSELLGGRVAVQDGETRIAPTTCRFIGAGVAAKTDRAFASSSSAHSGMFPCFLGGWVARLVRIARRALMTTTRVAAGSITPSSSPRSAARNGDATL